MSAFQLMEELDHQPNITARSLVTGRSYLIGLIVPDLLHPFFAEIAKALSAAIGNRRYSTIISSTEENPELEVKENRQLMGETARCTRYCLVGHKCSHFLCMDHPNLPYVLIDRELPALAANFVGTHDEVVGRIATENLIDQDCRAVAHIRGQENSTGIRRCEGYKRDCSAIQCQLPEPSLRR